MKCLWEVEREANKLYWNTGSVSIFLSYIDWSVPFFQDGVFRMLSKMVKFKMTSFPVCLSNRKCLHFPACNWFQPFSEGGGVSGYGALWWSHKCHHCLFCSPNRKCPHFPACNWSIHTVFSGRGLLEMLNTMVKPKMSLLPVLNGANQSITSGKTMALPVRQAKQEVTTFSASP